MTTFLYRIFIIVYVVHTPSFCNENDVSLTLYPEIPCTRNELPCPLKSQCVDYNDACISNRLAGCYTANEEPCYTPISTSSFQNVCPKGQLPSVIALPSITHTRCICPRGSTPTASGICQVDDPCSDLLKDRYCDQQCMDNPVRCSCANGFRSKSVSIPAYGNYTLCLPRVSDNSENKTLLGGPRLILNVKEFKKWNFSRELDVDALLTEGSKSFIFINRTNIEEPVIPTIRIRPTREKIKAIYMITKTENGKKHLSSISEQGSHIEERWPFFYKLKITDFALDWPSGNVYYLSSSEPKLTVCNTNTTAPYCRILEISDQLDLPSELVIDSKKGYMLIMDGSRLWRAKLNGRKLVSVSLEQGHGKHLTLDYNNTYLYYISVKDSSIYRINYAKMDHNTQPQKLMKLDLGSKQNNSAVEITSIAAVGRMLYVAVVKTAVSNNNTTHWSYIYGGISTNPFLTKKSPKVIASGPGYVESILIYHGSQTIVGDPIQTHRGCHIKLNDQTCLCMEGYEWLRNNTCVKFNESKSSSILYVSSGKRLIRAVTQPKFCQDADLDTVPMTPIQFAESPIREIGYDSQDLVVYFVTVFGVFRRNFNSENPFANDTGIRQPVGWYIRGLTINSRLRTMYYIVYNREEAYLRIVHLNNTSLHAVYPYSLHERLGSFSTKLFGSSKMYMMYIMARKPELDSYPNIEGESMNPLLTYDKRSGTIYYGRSNGFVSQGNSSSYIDLNLNFPLTSLTFGNDRIYLSYSGGYGYYNTTSKQLIRCHNITTNRTNLLHVKPDNVEIEPLTDCDNCEGICVNFQGSNNYTCRCGGKDDNDCKANTCELDEFQCVDKCIGRKQLCDGKQDCLDGEDERLCSEGEEFSNTSCDLEMHFSCRLSKWCIPKTFTCDRVYDCPDGSDENSVDCATKDKVCRGLQCPNSGICLDASSLCDGVTDCPESHFDEIGCKSCQGFRCSEPHARCIESVAVCDGFVDCISGDDEKNCSETTSRRQCGGSMFNCKNGQCVAELYRCDGEFDCYDKSDEENCTEIQCNNHEVKCNRTGRCIPKEWICDGQQDCSDGGDERSCPLSCNAYEFLCSGRNNVAQCIDSRKVCDSHADCAGGEDEGPGCNSNACSLAPCSHQCVVNPLEEQGYWCICPSDMVLLSNGTCIRELETCQNWGICSQLCAVTNKKSVKCSCLEDYTLEPDLYTCKHNDGPASLIFSNRHDLRLLPAVPGAQFSVLISSLRNTIAVDYHYEHNYIFWSDVVADKIYRGTRDTTSHTGVIYDVVEVITSGLPTAEGLAVDWIGDHIYWVESNLDIIEVADLDGDNRSTIISSSVENRMENPRSIALDPRAGLLFWADWGIKQIRRATMAGNDQRKLFDVDDFRWIPDGGWANGLTLDYDTERVYWIDAKSDTIQTVNYDGSDFRFVLGNSNLLKHPFAITVFGNWVYWSDWRTNSINRANKWNGTNAELVQHTFTQPFDLKVYHRGRQPGLPQNVIDPCSINNGNCSHICLRDGETSVVCACPHLLTLTNDNNTCSVLDSFVMLASSQFVSSISLTDGSSHGVVPTLAAPIIEKVYLIDFYWVSNDTDRKLFWGDSGLKAIASADIEGSKPKNILDLSTGLEFGFSVDYIHKRLYIVMYSLKPNSFDGTVDICEFDGSRRTTILSGLKTPKSISVCPEEGLMYILDEGSNAIYKLYMNGTFYEGNNMNSSNIIAKLDGLNVRGYTLSIDRPSNGSCVLYFGDSNGLYKYDGKKAKRFFNDSGEVWSLADSKLVYIKEHKLYVGPVDTVLYTEMTAGDDPIDIKLIHQIAVEQKTKAVCKDCNHYCLPVGDGAGTCKCYEGYVYSTTAKACLPIENILLYSVSPPDKGIYGLNLHARDDNSNIIAPIPQIYKPVALDYYAPKMAVSDDDYIYWIDSGHSISRSKRDLTGRSTIVSGLIAANDLVVDSSSGNMYWLDKFTGTIEVSKTNGDERYVLYHQEHRSPTAIAMHPGRGYIFFIADGIWRLTLRSEAKQIVNNTVEPSAVAVDWKNDRLYFCNTSAAIYHTDLDGNDGRKISLDQSGTCTSLAVVGDDIYYSVNTTSRVPEEIWQKNLHSGESKLLATVNGLVTDLVLATSERYQELNNTDNPCSVNYGGCDGLCLYNGSKDATVSHCQCTMGKLDKDLKTCSATQEFIVYSKVNSIAFLHLRNESSAPPYPEIKGNFTQNVIALTTDHENNKIYYSDIHRRTISWYSYLDKKYGDLVKDVDPVEGLAYENGHLYYTSQPTTANRLPQINQYDFSEGSTRTVVQLTTTDAPRAIAVHSCSGLIFWSNWNEAAPSIQRAETTGAHFTSIVVTNIVIPNGLVLDQRAEKLYWADANLDKIERCDFDGRHCVVIMSHVSPHIFAMAMYGDFLYWTDWMQRAVRMAHKLDGSFNKTLVARLPRQPMGIAVASDATCFDSPCYENPCSQICTTNNGLDRNCSCIDGYQLASDGHSCNKINFGDCDKGFPCGTDCLPWELTCDGINHCPSSLDSVFPSDEEPLFCATRVCPADRFITCRNQRCVALTEQCNGINDCGDFSDELSCTDACESAQYTCRNGQCIPLINRCDGFPHCWDKSDELPPDCNSTTHMVDCKEFYHPFYGHYKNGTKCPNTPVCIIEDWKCDGQNDCWDMADEQDCDKAIECSAPSEWACIDDSQSNNPVSCILSAWICDGDRDCPNGSDERNCSICPDDKKACEDGHTCIPNSWWCDGSSDCFDGSDETGCEKTFVCPDNSHFKCDDDKKCIRRNFVCDGEHDCRDGSDEQQHCPPVECKSQETRCADNRCIDKDFVCDGYYDCLDGSDEPDTCTYRKCDPTEEFKCQNATVCISLSSRCNGWIDCVDGSDEDIANCPVRPESPCPDGHWQCVNNYCINETKLCDGTMDCVDGSDEISCNLNECMELNGGCNHICNDDKVSYHCSCYQGYRLGNDNRTCEDIDECNEIYPCSQLCINIPGRYYCSCTPGFKLASDRKTCKPISGSSEYLMVASRYYIRNISLSYFTMSGANGSEARQSLVAKNLTGAVGLDYDWKEKMIYWSDVTNKMQNISRMHFNGTRIEILHWATTRHPDGLAVDWIGRNLYWSDNVLNTIEVSRLDGKYRKVLKRDVTEPRALQLYPARGYLFYTDWGQKSHIGRMGMDGSQSKIIINETIGWPNALAIDFYTDKLYFGDAKLDYIAMADLDGANRRIILNSGISHIYSITVFENSIYWSDWGGMKVMRADKFSGNNTQVLAELVHRPMDLRIVHPVNQAVKGDNPCRTLNCTGLCLLRPNTNGVLEATCACPEYHELSSDNQTCISKCSLSQFECINDIQCLHFTRRCDGTRDCSDGSDETGCPPTNSCGSFKYPCLNHTQSTSHSQCLDPRKLCDGVHDCPMGDDEIIFGGCRQYTCLDGDFLCSNSSGHYSCYPGEDLCGQIQNLNCTSFNHSQCGKSCLQSEFRCKEESRCIPLVFRCDGDRDCKNSSDESKQVCNAQTKCPSEYFSCNKTGQCIPMSWVCDGSIDCGNGYDEKSEICINASCSAGYFQCTDKRCIPKRWVCDFDNDCDDGSDEKDCIPRQCSETEWACKVDQRCILSKRRCDGQIDCIDGSDETDCDNLVCKDGGFRCQNAGGGCIPEAWKCNNEVDCPDQSDEANCTGRQCAPGEFQCNNSVCISKTFLCDNHADCADMSDENDAICAKNVCPPGRFNCANNKCIHIRLVCDGVDDCGDKSDENCTLKCKDDQYQCPDGTCLDRKLLCDGDIDCPVTTKNSLCNDGVCTNMINDEFNKDFLCRRMQGGCSGFYGMQYFLKTFRPGRRFGAYCNANAIRCRDLRRNSMDIMNITCEHGYEINVTNTDQHCNICQDKNECVGFGRCAQICDNMIGNYSCSCQEGFSLISRPYGVMHECQLNDEEPAPYLLVANGNIVRSFDMSRRNNSNGDERPSFLSFINNTAGKIDSLDVDTFSKNWVVYMLNSHSKSILKADISALQSSERVKRSPEVVSHGQQESIAAKSQTLSQPLLVRKGLTDPTSITFDWWHRNLYWTDATNATITLLNVDSGHEATIVTMKLLLDAMGDTHFSPQSIAVDPVVRASIYWVDCCLVPRIFAADLDGSNPRILTDHVISPSQVVCDISNQRIYWTDTKHESVNSIHYTGQDQRVHISLKGFKPHMLDIFGKTVMVTSFNRTSVVTFDKFINFTGRSQKHSASTVINSANLNIKDLAIVHRRKQYIPKDLSEFKSCPCSNTTIVTESYHDGRLRWNCVCPKDFVRINETYCSYCPCVNSGSCLNKPGDPVQCSCPSGYGGRYCQQHLCDNYCYAGSTCKVLNNTAVCICPPEMTGTRCEKSKCDNVDCNHGACRIDDGGVQYCLCNVGYNGTYCNQMQPRCERCGDRYSKCQYTGYSYECVCKTGYAGYNCHQCIRPHYKETMDCNGRGYCSSDSSGADKCVCTYKHFDPLTLCKHSVCTCMNGGSCHKNETDGRVSTICSCLQYYGGDKCERLKVCTNDYCQNGGTCYVDTEDNFAKCRCPRGFRGKTCKEACGSNCVSPDSNKCNNYCFNGGECKLCPNATMNLSSVDCGKCCNCSCLDSWTGDRCEERVERVSGSGSKQLGFVGPVVGTVAVFLVIAIIIAILFYIRHRRRERMFAHLRLANDDNTMHVSNPMYMKAMSEEEDDDLEPETANVNVYTATNTSNFANPLFKMPSVGKKFKDKEEQSALLVEDD